MIEIEGQFAVAHQSAFRDVLAPSVNSLERMLRPTPPTLQPERNHGLAPVSTIWRRNSGVYGGLVLAIVDSLNANVPVSTKPGQLHQASVGRVVLRPVLQLGNRRRWENTDAKKEHDA
jgi:hypothetical protein